MVITTSHPSPLGVRKGFFGSRIFTTANERLVSAGRVPVDWKLSAGSLWKQCLRAEELEPEDTCA